MYNTYRSPSFMWMLSFREGLKILKIPLFFFKCIFLVCKVFYIVFSNCTQGISFWRKNKGTFFVTPKPLIFSTRWCGLDHLLKEDQILISSTNPVFFAWFYLSHISWSLRSWGHLRPVCLEKKARTKVILCVFRVL